MHTSLLEIRSMSVDSWPDSEPDLVLELLARKLAFSSPSDDSFGSVSTASSEGPGAVARGEATRHLHVGGLAGVMSSSLEWSCSQATASANRLVTLFRQPQPRGSAGETAGGPRGAGGRGWLLSGSLYHWISLASLRLPSGSSVHWSEDIRKGRKNGKTRDAARAARCRQGKVTQAVNVCDIFCKKKWGGFIVSVYLWR
jgi:hypothetical protein